MNHLEFSFPLNLFAHLLWLEEGRVEALHLGLFEDPSEPASRAQRRATFRLLERLPPPPARILEVGVGVGTTAAELVRRGYQLTAISPERAQIEISKGRAPGARLLESRFEELPPGERFDLLLLQESAQYLDPLLLFDRGCDLLELGGKIVLADEFAKTRRELHPEPLHLLRDFLNQAERFGFRPVQLEEWSEQVLPSFDWLLERIERDRERLLADLSLNPEQLDRLRESLENYRRCYLEGRFGYFSLVLEREREPRWRIRECRAAEEPRIWALFSEVFGQEKPPEWWRWKYREARGIAAWQGDRPIAHYAGFPRRVLFGGREIAAVQIGDVMVHPKARASFTRKGAFSACMTTFAERWTGYGRPFPIGFGFPNGRAMRLGVRLGLYAKVGEVFELSWPVAPPPRLYRAEPLELERHAGTVSELWRGMAHAFRRKLIGVRDPAWLRYRYLERPDKHYRFLLVRQLGSGWPVAVVVLADEGERVLLADLVAPRSAFRAAVDVARALGGKPLYTWASDGALPAFEVTSPTIRPLGVEIPTCVWTEGPPPETLSGQWFLLAGDTDFL